MTVDMTFGEWHKRRRRQLDLTQSELAEQVGCSVGTIQKIEQNIRRPSKQLAELLATQLDIPAEQQPAFIIFARTEAYTAEMSEALVAMGETPLALETMPLKEEKVVPEAGPQTALAQTAHNLPLPATPFIGREAELAELDTLIADPNVRLVTIVGTGGMGKTRLALAAAERQLNNSPASTGALAHGVFFVDLARLDAGEQMIPVLADSLNFPLRSDEQEKRSHKQQILDYLRQKRILLVLDNFEHVLEEANLVADILRRAPSVQVLVTSRERLQLQGEHLFAIQGLDFPDLETPENAAEYTAVKLFLQSARRLRRNFQLQADDLTYLSRICRLVEGMPLAVELAAGWVDLLSLAEIAAELSKSSDMLETDMRNVPQRQRSLRAVFDTTWARLGQDEQAALMRFSLFRGGCTREAAQAVTGASLRTLANLSNKSLIQYRQRNGRYQIHTLLRQYAAEKLSLDTPAETTAKGAHCTYYCNALAQWERVLKDRRRTTAIAAIRADYDNIRTAWEWAVANGKIGDLSRASTGWGEYFAATGYLDDGERIFQEAVAAIKAGHPVIDATNLARLYVRLQTWLIQLNLDQHFARLRYHEEQERLLLQNLSLLSAWATAEDRFQVEEALTRLQLARIQKYGGEHQIVAAQTNLEMSLHLYQQLEDKAGIAAALAEIAWLHFHQRSLEQARELLSQCLAIWQETGSSWRLARGLAALQSIAQDMGDFKAGFEIIEQMSDVLGNLQTFRNSLGLAALLMIFDSKLIHLGRFADAQAVTSQFLAIYDDLGTKGQQLADAHAIAGYPLLYLGRYAEAREQAQRSLELYGNDDIAIYSFNIPGWVSLAEQSYAEASQWLTKACQMGQTGIVQPVDVGQAKATLAYAERGLGQPEKAKQHLFEVLKSTITTQAFMWFLPLIKTLSGIALLLADLGHSERAIEVYALASTHPMVANSQWFEDVAGRDIKTISATLSPDVVSAAEARGQVADLWEGSVALLSELEALGWGV